METPCREPRPRPRFAGWAVGVLAVLVPCLVGVTPAAATASAAGTPGIRSREAATRPEPLVVSRVDVSRYPQVGLVVTVPRTKQRLTARNFTIRVEGQSLRPWLGRLSSQDLQVILAPDTHLGEDAVQAERVAFARFLVDLPPGAQTAVVDPHRSPVLTPQVSGDPIVAGTTMALMRSGASQPASARLNVALAAFSPGSRIRRTVVLVVGADERLPVATTASLRQRLAASGTALYVLDASPQGAPAYATLAKASGGFAARMPAGMPAAAPIAAFDRIITDLTGQYYLRFSDPAPLPGRVTVIARTRTQTLRGTATLPVANPVAPPLPPTLPPPVLRPRWDQPLTWLATLLIVLSLCYGLTMLAASRREPRRRPARRSGANPAGSAAALSPERRAEAGAVAGTTGELFFVFLLPCLNEQEVILSSLERLLSIGGDNFVVLVTDDDSDDDTVALVSGVLGPRVWLLRRTPPDARKGKGEALNAAIRHIAESDRVDGYDPNNVIVVVVDADGRLDLNAVAEVIPYFDDPAVGAVQIGVRINNRHLNWLARMQDLEFVIYTEVFQRGRRHLGSVGLGGNGQFMRLSALRSLGPAPWSRSLTDDLDLGIRLQMAGWRNEYCSSVAVHQQGVVDLWRLIRQRSRWFQGHMQAWKLIPLVLRNAERRARADLVYHLSSPAVLLIASLLTASFMLSLADSLLAMAHGHNPFGWWLASMYALTFGPALAYTYVYWSRERDAGVSLLRVVGYAHLFVCYGMVWYISGWWAVGRTLRGQTGWAKTSRVVEAPPPPPTLPAAAGPPGRGPLIRAHATLPPPGQDDQR